MKGAMATQEQEAVMRIVKHCKVTQRLTHDNEHDNKQRKETRQNTQRRDEKRGAIGYLRTTNCNAENIVMIWKQHNQFTKETGSL